jgi:hypothetical protein
MTTNSDVFVSPDYEELHDLVFRDDYSGYKPNVAELPNGDGKVDADKRYAHVALKYLKTRQQERDLLPFLIAAHRTALQMAAWSEVPAAFLPDLRYSALRVLDYPPGSISNRHEDFDLFTVMCFRDQPDRFASEDIGLSPALESMRRIDPQAHLGELGEIIGLGRATPHWVLPSAERQRSIVYFAIPDHAAVLPTGVTVGDWLAERVARSRTYK